MFGSTWKVIPVATRGDWQSRLILIAQIAVGLAALVGLLALATRNPLLLLTFLTAQVLFVVGVVLFVIVAMFAQRTMILERYDSGAVIVRERDRCSHIYLIRSGNVEVVAGRADGTEEAVKRLGPGDHFGEAALLGELAHPATVRAVTAVEVLKMTPSNLVAFYTSLPEVQEHFRGVMESRLRELGTRK